MQKIFGRAADAFVKQPPLDYIQRNDCLEPSSPGAQNLGSFVSAGKFPALKAGIDSRAKLFD